MSSTNVNLIAPPYHVQSTAKNSRGGFPYFSHHDGVSVLWSEKWRDACVAGIYPFEEGNIDDFDPIFAELIRLSPDDPAILYRPDDYAKPFLPVGAQLVSAAEQARSTGSTAEARQLYLRAAAVYRIARFPINRSALSQEAWDRGKAAYEAASPLLDPPSIAVQVPFLQAETSAGDRDVPVDAYLRVPSGPVPGDGWPVLVFICGLDAYKTDHTSRTQGHVDHGYATLSFEIPGTGDCPASPTDPTSPDRLMSSILDWVHANASTYEFDLTKIVARGVSTGGYYALRVAHTHADRLRATVAQGSGCHHMFDREWIGAQNQMEYPFALADALAYKFGFRDGDPTSALVHYASEARNFSLVVAGILENPTCKLLVINGMEDTIFPIEDSIIGATGGEKRDLLIRGDCRHMGDPGAEEIVLEWIDKAVAGAS